MMIYLLVLFLMSTSMAYNNVDVQSATVYKGEGKDTLFGSVVGRTKKWLLIGAQGDSSRKGYGSFFSCKPGKANSCKRVPYHREAVYWDITVLDEIGQSIKGNTDGSSNFQPSMTCFTPSLSAHVFGSEYHSGCGMCWVTSTCRGSTKTQRKGKAFSANTCLDEVSAALLKGGQRQLLMMNRGSWGSHGSSNSTMDSDEKACDDPFLYIKTAKGGKVRASILQGKGMNKTNGYRGLSSTTVDFDGDGENDFVVGVPFSDSGIGSIEIYNKTFSLIGTISGQDVYKNGTGFGSSVMATDLNGDGFDDIIVGAPDFGNRISPQGRVFIFYYKNMEGYSTQNWDGMDGGDAGGSGHFGSVISGVGDINYDGYNDLCVGNQHFDGNIGKVLIYYGSRRGILLEPSQVIYGSDFQPPIKNFGMAISSVFVGTSKPDILVGGDNAAVYLRTRPVVYAGLSVSSNPGFIDLENKECSDEDGMKVTCFTIHTCFNHSGSGGTELPFTLEVSLDTDVFQPRAMFKGNNNSSEKVSVLLRKDTTSCHSMIAFFKEEPHWDYDIFTPIQVQSNLYLNLEAENQIVKGNAKLPPILDPIEASTSINIVKGCGADDLCTPDLYVNGSLVFIENERGTPDIELMVTVGNNGEKAFRVQLLISHPDELHCWTLKDYENAECSAVVDPNRVQEKCKLRKMIPIGEEVTSFYTFALDPERNIPTCTSQFTNFTLLVKSENPEEQGQIENNYLVIPYELPNKYYGTTSEKPITNDHRDDTTTTAEVPFQPTYTMRLSGVTEPDEIDDKFDGTIRHTFVVSNDGPHSLDKGIELEIIWPAKDRSGGHALMMINPPIVTGNGVCNISMPDCGPLLSMTKHQKMGRSQAIVESPQNCTLIECVIDEMAPRSMFSVTVRSTLDVKNFLKNRKGTDEKEDIQAYYFVAKAFLSTDGILEEGVDMPHELTLTTKLQTTMNSMSVRINGEVWTYTLLVILVHMSRLMIPV